MFGVPSVGVGVRVFFPPTSERVVFGIPVVQGSGRGHRRVRDLIIDVR